MDKVLLSVRMAGVTEAAWLAALALAAALTFAVLAARAHARRGAVQAARAEIDARMQELGRASLELNTRMQTMGEMLGSRQADLARLVVERLDAVGASVGQGLEGSAKSQADQLGRLNERLAVIDAAQTRLVGLTQEVVGLKDILANKQARGAFGQGRMEAIVRDGLPTGAYEFQATLSNKMRPDCVIRLPGDARVMVIDAKFPLEAFSALKGASDEAARKDARSRVRRDLGRHVGDIAERYFVAGETQDLAILFVPSESIHADLHEHFEDVIEKAHRARVMIVSPSLLMMAIQVMQTIVRDARVREQAHVIQTEVRRLLEDMRRLGERVTKLDDHFRLAQKDVADILTSSDKVLKRGERIDALEFSDAPDLLKAAE